MSGEWVPYSEGQQSGHQGAASEDAEPARRKVIDLAADEVRAAEAYGVTWRELADSWDVHHGVASSALSNAHRSGMIERLAKKRDGCGVYVTPSNVDGRPTIPHRSNKRPKEVTREQIAAEVHAWMAAPTEHEDHLIDRMVALLTEEKVQ